ncbi:uncharacterized protein LOC135088398 [Ostrinia nubilalis]|uniref:uncharacterized protein LOC135088398 n=1 Tax=Ostrinia nubilalis TaxID=29057 RepID=UPI003082611E
MFLALALLALLASARAQGQCQTDITGDTSGKVVVLRDQVVPAGTRDMEITLAANACASEPGRQHEGTAVTVCDWDAAPRVTMLNVRQARVTRTGSAVQTAVVHSTAYCK